MVSKARMKLVEPLDDEAASAEKTEVGPESRTSQPAPTDRPSVAPERDRPARPRRRRNIVLLLLAVAIGVGGYWIVRHPGETRTFLAGLTHRQTPAAEATAPAAAANAEPAAFQLSPVEVETVAPRTLTRTVRVSGALAPVDTTTLNAEVGGTVESVSVRIGDTVKTGDVVARIDTSDLEATLSDRVGALKAAQSALALSRTNLGNATKLAKQGYTTSSSLDEARNSVESAAATVSTAKAQLDLARSSMNDAVIRAPMDGIVSDRMVDPGQSVASGAKIVSIVDPSTMEAEVGIPTNQIADIAVGQSVVLNVEGFGDRSFEAKVSRISPVATAGTRTVPVYISLPNGDRRLSGGMFATGDITTEKRAGAIALPPAAIHDGKTRPYVLVVRDGKLARQSVTTGETFDSGNLVTIGNGLKSGETVVVAPLPSLSAGDAVTLDAG